MKLVAYVLLGLGLVIHHAEACTRLTAAFRYNNGRAHLFFGNEFVVLDQDNNELEAGDDVYSRYGINYPDAAFQFSLDGSVYFFSGAYYWGKFNNYHVPVEAKHFGLPFVEEGLDAAGNFNGSTHFFNGCMFVHDTPQGPSSVLSIPHENLCNVDAALEDGNNLMLFKDDKMWLLELKDDNSAVINDPVETDSVIHLNDRVLCKEGETEE